MAHIGQMPDYTDAISTAYESEWVIARKENCWRVVNQQTDFFNSFDEELQLKMKCMREAV